MRVLLLSDPSSPHTLKWVRGLSSKNIEVILFGLGNFSAEPYKEMENVSVFGNDISESMLKGKSVLAKLYYLKALPAIKKIIREHKPDLLHAHYATSYGLLGRLTGFNPFIISVWGSDVYDFPERSSLNKKLLSFNFSGADLILSTSKAMAKQTQKFTNKKIVVTPFGIDPTFFKPFKVENPFTKGAIVIGTIKTLEEIYGIEYLLRAFKILSEKYSSLPLKLLIVGGGSLETKFRALAKELAISEKTLFTGRVNYSSVPEYVNLLDIYVAYSLSESFGVAVLEASACEKPVVVSDVGGLPEVVENEVTGFVIKGQNTELLAETIEKLIINPELAKIMGKKGRELVSEKYHFNHNLEQMIEQYHLVIKKKNR